MIWYILCNCIYHTEAECYYMLPKYFGTNIIVKKGVVVILSTNYYAVLSKRYYSSCGGHGCSKQRISLFCVMIM